MIFTLEALQAKHGDSLVLHYGNDNKNPNIIIIDGGPSGVYKNFLKKRLLEIRDALMGPDEPLPISLLMVSHLDDDHVNGILQLTDDLQGPAINFDVENIWFNTFDDIIGNIQVTELASITASATVADVGGISPVFATIDKDTSAVIASTGQGRKLRNDAEVLSIPVNNPFEPLGRGKPALVRGDAGVGRIDWGGGLTIHVIHPNEGRLKELQAKWDEDLRAAKKKGDDSITVASFTDKSPFNLASIVCLVEFRGKTMLLTGDGRGDDILNGLRDADLLDNKGRIHVDILKMPHHGSDHNASTEFFKQVTADHYVFSGDGSNNNPEKSTLVMISSATRGSDDFTLYFTNRDGKLGLKKKLDEFKKGERDLKRKYGFSFRKDKELSLKVDLLDEIDY